jgi:cell division protein FtsQ
MKTRRRLLIVLAIVLVVLVPAAVFGGRALRHACETSPRLAIREIEVVGTRRLDPEDLAQEAGVQTGDNLFRMNPALAEARLSTNPWVAGVDIRRGFPSRVVIRIAEREPVALVDAAGWVAVDASGAILPLGAIEERFDLPIITGSGAPANIDPERLARGAAFLRIVAAERPYLLRDLSEVNVADANDLVAYTMHSGTAVRFGADGFAEKLARLVPVLEDLSGVDRIPVTIDLRFAGQAVVRFQEKSPKENEKEA